MERRRGTNLDGWTSLAASAVEKNMSVLAGGWLDGLDIEKVVIVVVMFGECTIDGGP